MKSKCKQCEESFKPERRNMVYCSTSCRNKAYYDRRLESEPNYLEKVRAKQIEVLEEKKRIRENKRIEFKKKKEEELRLEREQKAKDEEMDKTFDRLRNRRFEKKSPNNDLETAMKLVVGVSKLFK